MELSRPVAVTVIWNRVRTRPVGVQGLEQAVGIGGFELGILAVLQHRTDNGRLIAELFQHIGIGGPAGFRLFPVGQSQLSKENLA